jgi:hypothetical protein
MTNNNNLLASVALFGELYNSEKYSSLTDILSDYIIAAVTLDKRFSVNSTELKDLLFNTYGFIIPESVIRTTLKNRLKDCVNKENEIYHFNLSKLKNPINTVEEVEKIAEKQESILNALCEYISSKRKISINETDKERIRNNLSNYLMDNGHFEEYNDLISAFIISNEKSNDFNETLDSIKEGLVLYQGICFSEDISQLGSWQNELTVYLSTEHLFNCVGYNGSIFKEIFNDFYNLVKEINRASKNSKGNQIINLKYFDETKKEVDEFFQSAESIKKGYKRLDPTKNAMKSILDGCKDVNDVKLKQVNFYIELKKLGILIQEYSYSSVKNEYNVVDENIIQELKKNSGKNRFFDEDYCWQCLRIFSKINYFRRGVNNLPFEKIKHIYITENNFAKYLAHNNKVKFNDTDISFAKDIDYIITRFWFKLKKGFNNKTNLPKTFFVLTKAKIVIASRLNNSVSKCYDKLQKEYKSGKLNEEQAIELNRVYKEKPIVPEQISMDNIDDSLNFLENDSFIEDFLREKTRKESEYKKAIIEKSELEKELEYYKQKEKEEEQNKISVQIENESIEYANILWGKFKKHKFSSLLYTIYVFLLTSLPVIIGFLLKIIEPFNLWMISIGKYQLIIWAILLLVFVLEIFGRAYIFDKEKIRDGWCFIKVLLRLRYSALKDEKINEFKFEYKTLKPSR